MERLSEELLDVRAKPGPRQLVELVLVEDIVAPRVLVGVLKGLDEHVIFGGRHRVVATLLHYLVGTRPQTLVPVQPNVVVAGIVNGELLCRGVGALASGVIGIDIQADELLRRLLIDYLTMNR